MAAAAPTGCHSLSAPLHGNAGVKARPAAVRDLLQASYRCQHARPFQHATPSTRPDRQAACQAYVEAPPAPASVASIKEQLTDALKGTNRGIFGLPSRDRKPHGLIGIIKHVMAAKRTAILDLLQQLEAENPVPAPTQQLGMCHGHWKLLFSTITITGVKRTKLGLREFIRLGEFTQIIDTQTLEAVNVVEFSVAGLSMVGGALTITATYQPASPQRVSIQFKEATLVPAQLQKLFEQNYDLLLSIFNPDGHLDITYLDSTHRVGRDDKGNVFLLQRVPSP